MDTRPSSAAELGFTIPLTKIDVEKRLVYGVAALEQPDRTNEILDYEWSKPNFIAWSKSFEDATGGLSKGNVRVMHTKQVAGSLKEFICDDLNKTFNVCAHIVDDQDWRKVLTGAYTGFSVGGSYGRSRPDGVYKRYEAKPNEISLVDRPCIPGAQFVELVKADGVVEQMQIHPSVAALSFGERRALAKADAVASTAPSGFAKAWSSRPVGFSDRWALQKAEKAEGAVSRALKVGAAIAGGAAGLALARRHGVTIGAEVGRAASYAQGYRTYKGMMGAGRAAETMAHFHSVRGVVSGAAAGGSVKAKVATASAGAVAGLGAADSVTKKTDQKK